MQYILTEEEYNELKSKKKEAIKLQTEELQKLCSEIADKMPVIWGWNGQEPKPWGCVLTTKREWYCDKCPVSKICPNPDKEWSK